MKKCPVCNRTYADETLNFCLEDGATLVAAANTQSGFGSFPSQTNPQSWQPLNVPQNFAPPAPKKSKTWLWVLGILGAIVVFSVVGAFGLLLAIGIAVGNENKNGNRSDNRTISNRNPVNRSANHNVANSVSNSVSNSAKTGGVKYDDDDFSSWGKIDSQFGRAETKSGEYHVSSKKSDNYYVIVADKTLDQKYVTNNATTKVTARSVTGASPHLGYGLLVHSDPVPLIRDFAFLIRTDAQPSFRVVKHENNTETELVKWTPASQIRTGTEPNELEVRSDGKQLQFYINGQYATSISDTSAGKGIVGIYTSGTPIVAFSNLKISDN